MDHEAPSSSPDLETPLIRESKEDFLRRFSKPLHKACSEGNWREVDKIISQAPDRNYVVTNWLPGTGETALVAAIKGGKVGLDFIKKLVDEFKADPQSGLTKKQFGTDNTALHEAAMHSSDVEVAKLLVTKCPTLLTLPNRDGLLPLHLAANHCRKDVSTAYRERKVMTEYQQRQKHMTVYLMSALLQPKNNQVRSIWDDLFKEDKDRVNLLFHLAKGGCYDFVLCLIKWEARRDLKSVRDYIKKLAKVMEDEEKNIFQVMAEDTDAFTNARDFNFWESLIYSYAPMTMPVKPPEILLQDCDDEAKNPDSRGSDCEKLWTVAQVIVPSVKRIRDKKLSHHQALELVHKICSDVVGANPTKRRLFHKPFLQGVQSGLHEFVDAILENHMEAIDFIDEENRSAFHLAVKYRHEEVLKILLPKLNTLEGSRRYDIHRNNILHLVAYKASQDRLDLEPRGVLQMQREIQWYKEVEKLVTPEERKKKNSGDENFDEGTLKELLRQLVTNEKTKEKELREVTLNDLVALEEMKSRNLADRTLRRLLRLLVRNEEKKSKKLRDVTLEELVPWEEMNLGRKTPLEIFIEEHGELVDSEKRRLKEMATACMVASGFIASAAFGVVISAPGGNDSNGHPILSKEPSFLVFVIAGILAFLLAIDSIISFISLYTSGYGSRDFLRPLPIRMIIGLISMLLSLFTLMIAFSAAVFLVIAKQNVIWLAPIVVLAGVPVILCAYLQFPPMFDMIKSTFRPVNLTALPQ